MSETQFNKPSLSSICRGCFHNTANCQKKTLAASKGFCLNFYKSGSIVEKAFGQAMAQYKLGR